jgi:hypothetical protein
MVKLRFSLYFELTRKGFDALRAPLREQLDA